MNIKKQWDSLIYKSQILTRELKQAEYLYYTTDDPKIKVEIWTNMIDIQHKIDDLKVEAAKINEIAENLIHQGVMI